MEWLNTLCVDFDLALGTPAVLCLAAAVVGLALLVLSLVAVGVVVALLWTARVLRRLHRRPPGE